jgi:tetratricopeptide (TPR) repeat protein
MAEVLLQDGEYEAALPYAQKALELEPLNWIASYNLGMIEDRLQQWQSALIHLQQALDAGIPDSRHRLLAHLWAARANHALGDDEAAHAAIAKLRRESSINRCTTRGAHDRLGFVRLAGVGWITTDG